MNDFTRRDFVARSLTTVGTAGLLLASNAAPTEACGGYGAYLGYEPPADPAPAAAPANLQATEPNIQGPFYRAGAPHRAKITPPLEPGTVLLISGRVWGQETRRPLPNAVLDIWQANAQGRYDNDDPRNPPARGVFKNRARLLTDENGYYEFESIHPGAYQTGANTWRPSHIHYMVTCIGYRQLITQLYFRGDRYNQADAFIRASLIIDLREQRGPNNNTYESGTFDIVLAPVRG